MTKKTVVIFLVMLCLWNIADANTGESLEMRIYDRDLQVSDSEMHMMLEKAALEENGFKLEITTKVVSESGTGSDNPAYQKTHFYYKIVDCTQVPEVTEQLRSLIPGVLGRNIVTRVRREIKNRDLDNLKKCLNILMFFITIIIIIITIIIIIIIIITITIIIIIIIIFIIINCFINSLREASL